MKLSYCGLDCNGCDGYIATKNDDAALRAEIAAKWSKDFGHAIAPEDIHCVGCPEDGRHIAYCESMCEIRKCARGRAVATCAACADFESCAHLQGFFKMAPHAKANLDALRAKG